MSWDIQMGNHSGYPSRRFPSAPSRRPSPARSASPTPPPPDSNAAADEKEFQRQELLRIAAAKQSADAIDTSAAYALTTGEALGEVHGAWLPEGLSFVVSATVDGVENAAIGFETKNGGQHLLTLEMVSGHWSWLPETGWFTKSRNTEWLPATQVSRIKARFDGVAGLKFGIVTEDGREFLFDLASGCYCNDRSCPCIPKEDTEMMLRLKHTVLLEWDPKDRSVRLMTSEEGRGYQILRGTQRTMGLCVSSHRAARATRYSYCKPPRAPAAATTTTASLAATASRKAARSRSSSTPMRRATLSSPPTVTGPTRYSMDRTVARSPPATPCASLPGSAPAQPCRKSGCSRPRTTSGSPSCGVARPRYTQALASRQTRRGALTRTSSRSGVLAFPCAVANAAKESARIARQQANRRVANACDTLLDTTATACTSSATARACCPRARSGTGFQMSTSTSPTRFARASCTAEEDSGDGKEEL